MRSRSRTDWVIVKFADEVHDGRVTIWRDHGTAWGSPQYMVLGYFSGTYQGARQEAKRLKKQYAHVTLDERYGPLEAL